MVSITRRTPTGESHVFSVTEEYWASLNGYSILLSESKAEAEDCARGTDTDRTITIEEKRYAVLNTYDAYSRRILELYRTQEDALQSGYQLEKDPQRIARVKFKLTLNEGETIAPISITAKFKIPLYTVTFLYARDYDQMTPDERKEFDAQQVEANESNARYAKEDAERKRKEEEELKEAARKLLLEQPEAFGIVVAPDTGTLIEERGSFEEVRQAEEIDSAVSV